MKKRLTCPVCGGREYWWRYTYHPLGEPICADCGSFCEPYCHKEKA